MAVVFEGEAISLTEALVEARSKLSSDLDGHLLKIDRYCRGDHDKPYTPRHATDEYKELANRSITNWSMMPVKAVVQGLTVDGFRSSVAPGEELVDPIRTSQWDLWQKSRMDAHQIAVHRSALQFGHSFVVVDTAGGGEPVMRGLSPLRTVALFVDPAWDDNAELVLSFTPSVFGGGVQRFRAWTRVHYIEGFFGAGGGSEVTITHEEAHGFAGQNPVTRFAASVDLEGRTVGLVEPMIPLQDRLNQTQFDLLITQAYSAWKVRTATGLIPQMKMRPVYELDGNGEPVVDPASGEKVIVSYTEVIDPATGLPVPAEQNLSQADMLFAEDPSARFGTLDATELAGFIAASELGTRQYSAIAQVPPHYMLGEIANISAEAIEAAGETLTNLTEEFARMFGESWERVFRLASYISGDVDGAEDWHGEVIWRDTGLNTLARDADALGKLAEMLDVPKRGLWARVPNVTVTELGEWDALRAQDDSRVASLESERRAFSLEGDPAGLGVEGAGASSPFLGSA